MITDAIQKLIERQHLTMSEARAVMEEIMTGQATDAQVAGLLVALRMKGETAQELIGFARVMQEKAETLWDGEIPVVLDNCGTGGDRSGTFNISTASAFVVAGAGIRVAKHGNRSASSLCGSADVMEALGIDIQMPMPSLRQAIMEVGIGFLFARRFLTSMKYVAPARTELKTRTVFNVLGPLANPGRARFQVIGVFSRGVMEMMAEALHGLKVDRAFVVHGSDGMDEISISGNTHIAEMRAGNVNTYTVSPEDFGIRPRPRESIAGGDAVTNAAIIEAVLNGEPGPHREVVLMNAAVAIVAGGAAETLREGIRVATQSIDTGTARSKLIALRESSRKK